MKTLHVVPHTHWDREWYQTFQEFRARLVRLMDGLLELLERDLNYRFFTLDGQTVVLDDYLEIRPEAEPRIRQLVADGRLLAGPWYILPDEFLEGPEAMLRNLIFGERGCRRFAAERQPMEQIGYLPDPFGHVSQLPQIASGFEWQALCFWRGVGDAPTEFRWAAPDGTECLVLHLRNSYSNGAWLPTSEEGFVRDLAAERDALAPHATTGHLLVMQGTDHMEPRPDLPERLRAAGVALGDHVLHSTLPAYLRAVQAELGAEGMAGLHLVRGELRSPQRAHSLPAVLSSRIWIKQWNARCETLLTRWAEPFSALAGQIAGSPDQRGFLRKAWEWLLKNHPHDSICGCSADQVHREMRTRFAWAEQIAETVIETSLEALAQRVGTQQAEAGARDGPSVIVFNPTPSTRTGRVRVRIRPAPEGEWSLVDSGSRPVPTQVLGRRAVEQLDLIMDRETLAGWLARISADKGHIHGDLFLHGLEIRVEDGLARLEVTAVADPAKAGPGSVLMDALERAEALLADGEIQSYHVRMTEDLGLDLEFLARDVPGLGYTRHTVRPGQGSGDGVQGPGSTHQSPQSIENEFFLVDADASDGTLTILDKATGQRLVGVNRFVDGGDRGDEYTHCPPEHDSIVDRPAAAPSIERADGGIGPALQIQMRYRVPAALCDGDRSTRSDDTVDLPISSRITLTPGVRRVEFETTMDNLACDHRLRVHFPTPIVTGSSWAESHFNVIERPVALPAATADWAEQPTGTHPQLTFADVSDGQRGVMLANRGLPEYEVLPGTESAPGVTLALTLLRCVGWLSRGDLHNRNGHAGPAVPTPEAQCPGQHTFHYALVPHTGSYLSVQAEAHAFNAPLRAACTHPASGTLPPSGSFLQVSPAAVVISAVKAPEEGGGLVVRLHNSAPVAVQARVRMWQRFAKVDLVTMNEKVPLRPLARDSDTVELSLRAKEIATMHLHWRRDGGD